MGLRNVDLLELVEEENTLLFNLLDKLQKRDQLLLRLQDLSCIL